MQIVIDIPEEDYERLKEYKKAPFCSLTSRTYEAVANGVPLSKGHGRILDEKEILNTEKYDGGWYDLVDLPEYIAGVSAIVEADKESEIKE